MIQLNDIYFSYKKGEQLLKELNFTFEDNSRYIILGKNGCGKTTLLRLLCGLLKLNSGSIIFPENQVIGFLPDNNGIYENMTILENIKFRIALYKLSYENLVQDINELLLNYDLIKYKDRLVSELSMGMKKKTALICTYIINPDVLILDEPTGGIDVHSSKELIAMLNIPKKKNVITIITTHDMEFVNKMNAINITIDNGMLRYEPNL